MLPLLCKKNEDTLKKKCTRSLLTALYICTLQVDSWSPTSRHSPFNASYCSSHVAYTFSVCFNNAPALWQRGFGRKVFIHIICLTGMYETSIFSCYKKALCSDFTMHGDRLRTYAARQQKRFPQAARIKHVESLQNLLTMLTLGSIFTPSTWVNKVLKNKNASVTTAPRRPLFFFYPKNRHSLPQALTYRIWVVECLAQTCSET